MSNLTCPSCGKNFSVLDAPAGPILSCPNCNAAITSLPPPPKTSGLATAGLIASVFGSIIPFGAVPGIILCIISLVQIKKSRGRLVGKAMAITGIVIAIAAFSITMHIYSISRETARRSICYSNLGQISLAIAAYQTSNTGYLPYDARGPRYSLSLLYPQYISDPTVFVCRSVDKNPVFPPGCSLAGKPCSYGYLQDIPYDGPDNPTLPPGLIICGDYAGNHEGGGVVVGLDGRAEWSSELLPFQKR
jgi:hypothetical protein